jgi:hypothetical protein
VGKSIVDTLTGVGWFKFIYYFIFYFSYLFDIARVNIHSLYHSIVCSFGQLLFKKKSSIGLQNFWGEVFLFLTDITKII